MLLQGGNIGRGVGGIILAAPDPALVRSAFEQLAAESPFQTCTITTEGIGLEVSLTKQGADRNGHAS